MKKLNIVLGVLVGAAIPYLLFTFVQMDFNAGNWSEFTRCICALVMCFGGLIGVFFVRMIEEGVL